MEQQHNSTGDQIMKLLLKTWTLQNKRVTDFFAKYAEEIYYNEVAPDRNRAIYLLGHLVATNDGLLPLLGIGKRLYPKLQEPFQANADNEETTFPKLVELQQYWENVNAKLTEHFNKWAAAEWLEKHTAVSVEDFAINPERNKMNALIGRTTHQSYHLGQLAFLVPRVVLV